MVGDFGMAGPGGGDCGPVGSECFEVAFCNVDSWLSDGFPENIKVIFCDVESSLFFPSGFLCVLVSNLVLSDHWVKRGPFFMIL